MTVSAPCCRRQESQLSALRSKEAAANSKVTSLEKQLAASRKELDDFVTRVGAAEEKMKTVKQEVKRRCQLTLPR